MNIPGMTSIMDLFRSAPGTPTGGTPPVNPNANPNNVNPNLPPSGVANPTQPLPGTQSTQQTAPNGTVPANADKGPARDPNDPLALLDGFSKTLETAITNPAGAEGTFAKLDPAKVMESAKGLDFTKLITPENATKIAGGGQEAVAAMATVINTLGQSVSGQGTITTAKLIDAALAKQREEFVAALPGLVNNAAVADSLRTENPMMSHPAIQPLVGALQAKVAAQYPTATSSEIQEHVRKYFDGLSQVFAPKPEPTAAAKASAQEFDFSAFLK